MGLKYFKPDPAAYKSILVSPEVAAIMASEAERAKGIAEGLAADFAVTGDYERAFSARTEIVHLPGDEGGIEHDVVAGILSNTSEAALGVEYGYAGRHDEPGSKPHRVMGRTLVAMEGTA